MAEAVKIKKAKQKQTNEHENAKEDNDEEISNLEINDKTIQKRLKALTSFINNLEPTESNLSPTSPSMAAAQTNSETVSNVMAHKANDCESEKLKNDSNYYEMISKKAESQLNEEERSGFTKLNDLLNGFKQDNKLAIPNAPPIAFQSSSSQLDETLSTRSSTSSLTRHPFLSNAETSYFNPLLTNESRDQSNLNKQANIAVDYNLERIRQINKLHYPRLNWNQLPNTLNQMKLLDGSATQPDVIKNENQSIRQHLVNKTDEEQFLKRNLIIEQELMRFYEKDQLCKDLEVYYKCKQIQLDAFNASINEFYELHSNTNHNSGITSRNENHEFFQLIKDYYEARMLVNKCIRHMNEFKWQCITSQMRTIWSFEKYTIESTGTCGDQQLCKHELKSEKAYLNKLELNKLQQMLYELRFNLIKNGLLSSQFCSKLAKTKIQSYLHDFINNFNNNLNELNSYKTVNCDLKWLIDILFYFYRKTLDKSTSSNTTATSSVNKSNVQVSSSQTANEAENVYDDFDENINNTATNTSATNQNSSSEQKNTNEGVSNEEDLDNIEDELFKSDIKEWLKWLNLLLNLESERNYLNRLLTDESNNLIIHLNIHFDNTFFTLQHLLRSPGAYNYSYLFKVPLLADKSNQELVFKRLNLNNSKSDLFINLYFDFYLKLFASFSYEVKFRNEFLSYSMNTNEIRNSNWQLIDLEGDFEAPESVLIDINEDDLVKLYYQIPFNAIYKFLWTYLSYQNLSTNGTNKEQKSFMDQNNIANLEFRRSYVCMKILSFLDYLSRLSIRTLFIYNRLKYKQFAKLVGKTLKDAIKFVSFLQENNNTDSFKLHYDNFVKRIFTTIIYSSRVKSLRWTILSQLNLGSLCLRTKWLILSIMCGIDVYHDNFVDLFNNSKPVDYIWQAVQNDLENLLAEDAEQTTNDIEILSFMRTLHFLINLNKKASENEENQEMNEFMSCVVKVIFKIAYCYSSTREICHKEGNSLLFAICSVYPYLISTVISEIDSNLNKIGKRALFLGAELPFDKWLVHIDTQSDLIFIQKCLVFNMTNSILFRLAENIIDNLDFSKRSEATNSEQVILIKLKLAIILFELHSRLTIYNYYSKSLEQTDFQLFTMSEDLTNVSSKDELNAHYSQLAKDKRLLLVNWIWSTIHRFNLYIQIDSIDQINYFENLSISISKSKLPSQRYMQRFFEFYLNQIEYDQQLTQLPTTLTPKCPLECYLRLIFSRSGHDLEILFDHSFELIQTILSSHKKQAKLQSLTYTILFNWLEDMIYSQFNHRLEQFREAKHKHMNKLSSILLQLISFAPSSSIVDSYCCKLHKRLSNQNYLYLWLEVLITSAKHWHKYKNLVKIVDFLVGYSFQLNKSSFINTDLLEELMTYVRNDFSLNASSANNAENSEFQAQSTNNSKPSSALSNWLQPSFNWINSSISMMVNIASSSSTSEFESNQNFTYDKRLFKEFPFAGFYLCLCEERIECELELWTIFRSHLLADGENSAISYIEASWRKTLNSINKSLNLNINITPQRLMLFKWCERALELPYDHPMLILYWQKFFFLYLDKDYYTSISNMRSRNNQMELELIDSSAMATSSTLNNPTSVIQSPTFKLFTSTTQLNSLLKQMKKQLELTSEHYAYQCSPNAQSNTTPNQPSAPLSTYHYNEMMSKLFYALSLWIDETRLHDPNLYLPALPSHYEPNLLAKIFSKQSDYWLQYVDMNKIIKYLNSIIKNDSKAQSIKLTEFVNGQVDGGEQFFESTDRLVLNQPSQLDLRFTCPLKEKFGTSIESLLSNTMNKEEMHLVLNVCEHLLRNIFKYNKEIINHTLNHMLKLDDKLINKLLVHLWHNETCEKYVQVPCSSLINPMHQCSRPAMVKFVYEVATKRDQFRHEIKENRLNHEKLLLSLIEDVKVNSCDANSQAPNQFPNDDIIKSMVAMSQLIKRLLRNYHKRQQQNDSFDSDTHLNNLLTNLFYLLIDLYETHMNHPNDVVNAISSNGMSNQRVWPMNSLPHTNHDSLEHYSSINSNEQSLQSADSIHLYIFDLIHLIGVNFIQISFDNSRLASSTLKKRNQRILLEKIIQKLTSTLTIPPENLSSSSRRNNNTMLNLTKNKLTLMNLCSQYVEPNDLDLFNEFYMNILCSVTTVLQNETENPTNLDSIEMINKKFSIILQLLSKFSFLNLNKLLSEKKLQQANKKEERETETQQIFELCSAFVDINTNFLNELKYDLNESELDIDQQEQSQSNDISSERKRIREANLKLIVDQCIDNFVSILNINYPNYFDYMLKICLEFSGNAANLKYGTRHLKQFNMIIQQHETLVLYSKTNLLTRANFERIFAYLKDYFNVERNRLKNIKRTFYSAWCTYAFQYGEIYSNLILTYIDRFIIKELRQKQQDSISETEQLYDKLWENIIINLYSVWIEPASIKDIASFSLINVKQIYENEIVVVSVESAKKTNSPGSAIMFMIHSFLSTGNSLLERIKILENGSYLKNYALNKFIHYYYEQIACALSSSSSINDNTLDCYHKCLSKYTTSWFYHFEPDYRSINIMTELCSANNNRLIKFLAFDLVSQLDLNKLVESYFQKMEPIQINDFLKCWLQLLTEFCLRDQIRESNLFDSLLRPIYNQAEILQCWSMLSDTSYADVIINRFVAMADYKFAFASRGTERGVIMNLLKSASEFYSISNLSCFASPKRRCFLRAVCKLLLKSDLSSIKVNIESFQNCIMNMLTDIETFSISASSNDDPLSINLKQEIQLLIDECLSLVYISKEASEIFTNMFEYWLASSKDSPILLHFINRISNNYNIFHQSPDKYCNLLELCIEVYFETNRSNVDLDEDKKFMTLFMLKNIDQETSNWKQIIDDLDFKFNEPLFEMKCLKNSCYLLLTTYLMQRLNSYKLVHGERSNQFYEVSLRYIDKLLETFFNESNSCVSKPQELKEEKFILVMNKLIEFYLSVLRNSNSPQIHSSTGEQLIKLSNLLYFYGEDLLSNQNPLNDGQSVGSDLLASIGLNILAKKSQYSVKFRLFARSMSICILKQIMIVNQSDIQASSEATLSENNKLYPVLEIENKLENKSSSLSKWFYKVRMSHLDVQTESMNLSEDGANMINKFSSSLPNTSNLLLLSPQKISPLHAQFNKALKQSAYQFNSTFQNKAYSNDVVIHDLLNYVNQHLHQQTEHFCLPQVYNMSKYFCIQLFKEKYYLF